MSCHFKFSGDSDGKALTAAAPYLQENVYVAITSLTIIELVSTHLILQIYVDLPM